jgi:hypothetical protein
MTRAEKRELKRNLKKDIAEFLKIQNHYFPNLINDIKNASDQRHQSYITYEIEVIIYIMILKNVCSIASMQEMNDVFNEDDCLSKLEPSELEKIRKGMIKGLLRKKCFDSAKFLGKYWLVI